MKLANAIKKLTTNGFEVTTSAHTLQAKKGNQIVGCAISRDGSANSFYTKNADQHSDVQRDYFVERWHNNISQAIQFVNRYDKN
jgi:hypothetical protein